MAQNDMPDVVYDLRRFVSALPEEHRDLAKRAKRWIDAHSIATDLRIARDCVEDALRFDLSRQNEVQLAIMALMQSAVMAYARAMERHSDHRGRVPIQDRFSSEETELHAQICHLRDEALAHFGPAGTFNPWNEDYALLLQTGIFWQPVISSRRSLFDRGFARRLIKHLCSVEQMVVEAVEARRIEFQELFHERVKNDEVADLLQASELTPAEVAEVAGPIMHTPRHGRQIIMGPG